MRIVRAAQHTVRRTLLAGAAATAMVATALVVGLATPAYACTCVATDLQTQAKQADAVFVGTAVRVTEDGKDRTYEVRVSDVYAGTVDPVTTVRTSADSASCGIELTLDQQYMFLGDQDEAHGEVSTGMCSGTRPISDQAILAVEKALGPATPYRDSGGNDRGNGGNDSGNDKDASESDDSSGGSDNSDQKAQSGGESSANAGDEQERSSADDDGNVATYTTVGVVLAVAVGASFLLPRLRRRNRGS